MVAAAIIGSAVVGGVVASSSASKAAKAQTNAANAANQTIKDQQAQTRADLMPFSESGRNALTGANNLLGLGTDAAGAQKALTQTPGYQFTMSQGLRAVANSNATRLGGAATKGALNYASGLANQTYGDQYNRLMDMVKTGESAAAQTGAFGAQSAQAIGENQTAIGNAKAASQIATGNALSGIANAIPSAMIYNKLYSDPSSMYGKVG